MRPAVLLLLLAGCTTPTLQQQADQMRREALWKCVQDDRASHWPNIVIHRGLPPQCRRYL